MPNYILLPAEVVLLPGGENSLQILSKFVKTSKVSEIYDVKERDSRVHKERYGRLFTHFTYGVGLPE